LAGDTKLIKIIKEARKFGPSYRAPCRNDIGRRYLDSLYKTNWKEQMKTLLSEARTFDITVFGDGATISTVPLVNVVAQGTSFLTKRCGKPKKSAFKKYLDDSEWKTLRSETQAKIIKEGKQAMDDDGNDNMSVKDYKVLHQDNKVIREGHPQAQEVSQCTPKVR
jgi:hypothetical protein